MLKMSNHRTIRLISSYSGFGGSTLLLIALCKIFNNHNMPCVFYGPQPWHTSKDQNCQLISNFTFNPQDYFIGHLLDKSKTKFISLLKNHGSLTIHEKSAHLLSPEYLTTYDNIVFVSQSHMDWHGYYQGPQKKHIIRAPQAKLQKTIHPEGIAGVIGQMEPRKLPHVSILRALKDGCKKVLLFGPNDNNPRYFKTCVVPLLSDKVIYMGNVDDRQRIYGMISCVYHSSTEECDCLLQGECENVGIPFYGNCNIPSYDVWSDLQIANAWKGVLNWAKY